MLLSLFGVFFPNWELRYVCFSMRCYQCFGRCEQTCSYTIVSDTECLQVGSLFCYISSFSGNLYWC